MIRNPALCLSGEDHFIFTVALVCWLYKNKCWVNEDLSAFELKCRYYGVAIPATLAHGMYAYCTAEGPGEVSHEVVATSGCPQDVDLGIGFYYRNLQITDIQEGGWAEKHSILPQYVGWRITAINGIKLSGGKEFDVFRSRGVRHGDPLTFTLTKERDEQDNDMKPEVGKVNDAPQNPAQVLADENAHLKTLLANTDVCADAFAFSNMSGDLQHDHLGEENHHRQNCQGTDESIHGYPGGKDQISVEVKVTTGFPEDRMLGITYDNNNLEILQLEPGGWADQSKRFSKYVGWRIEKINGINLRSKQQFDAFNEYFYQPGEPVVVVLTKTKLHGQGVEERSPVRVLSDEAQQPRVQNTFMSFVRDARGWLISKMVGALVSKLFTAPEVDATRFEVHTNAIITKPEPISGKKFNSAPMENPVKKRGINQLKNDTVGDNFGYVGYNPNDHGHQWRSQPQYIGQEFNMYHCEDLQDAINGHTKCTQIPAVQATAVCKRKKCTSCFSYQTCWPANEATKNEHSLMKLHHNQQKYAHHIATDKITLWKRNTQVRHVKPHVAFTPLLEGCSHLQVSSDEDQKQQFHRPAASTNMKRAFLISTMALAIFGRCGTVQASTKDAEQSSGDSYLLQSEAAPRCRCRVYNTKLSCQGWNTAGTALRWLHPDEVDGCPQNVQGCCDLPCASGEVCSNMPPTIQPTEVPSPAPISVPDIPCRGNQSTWIGRGPCGDYASDHDSGNYDYCATDCEWDANENTELCAADVCPQCEYCYACDVDFIIQSTNDVIMCETIKSLKISQNFHGVFDASTQAPNVTNILSSFEIDSPDLLELKFPLLSSIGGELIIRNSKVRVLSLDSLETIGRSMKIENNELQDLYLPALASIGLHRNSSSYLLHAGGGAVISQNRFLKTINLPSILAIGSHADLCHVDDDPAHIQHLLQNRLEVSNPRLEEVRMPLLNNVAGHISFHRNYALESAMMPLVKHIGGDLDLSPDGTADSSNPQLRVFQIDNLKKICGKVDIRHSALETIHLPALTNPVSNVYVHCNAQLRFMNLNRLPDIFGNLEVVNNQRLRSRHFIMGNVRHIGRLLYFSKSLQDDYICGPSQKALARRALSETDEHHDDTRLLIDNTSLSDAPSRTSYLTESRRLTEENEAYFEEALSLWLSDPSASEDRYGHISSWDTSAVLSLSYAFEHEIEFNEDISAWDVSKVVSLRQLFRADTGIFHNFNQDLSLWDVANVVDMSSAFSMAAFFNADLSAWDIAKVIQMYGVFRWARSFDADLSSWDVAKVADMRVTFKWAPSFNADLSKWDVSKSRDISGMFHCFNNNDGKVSSFNADLSTWNVAKVKSMEFVFVNARSFNADLSSWDVAKVKSMTHMFRFDQRSTNSFNADVSPWDVAKVGDMGHMFENAVNFNRDLSSWNVAQVKTMSSMFVRAESFNADLSAWDVSKVRFSRTMFYSALSFNADLATWDVTNVEDMNQMFRSAASFSRDLSTWNLSNVNELQHIFEIFVDSPAQFIPLCGAWQENPLAILGEIYNWLTLGCPSTGAPTEQPTASPTEHPTESPTKPPTINLQVAVAMWIADPFAAEDRYGHISRWDTSATRILESSFYYADRHLFNADLSAWDVSRVTSTNGLFEHQYRFNADLAGWDVSKVTTMHSMLREAYSFNADLSSWDVSKVTSMFSMFNSASSFNGDLSAWDVSKSEGISCFNCPGMFENAEAFNRDLTAWDVSKVLDMKRFFMSAFVFSSFNGDLSPWNVAKVTSMFGMFYGAVSFNGDLSAWDVAKVENMYRMLYNAISFNGDLSPWDVANVNDMQSMFEGASSFNSDLSSWDVASAMDMNGIFDGSPARHIPLCGTWQDHEEAQEAAEQGWLTLSKQECTNSPTQLPGDPSISPTGVPTSAPSLNPSSSPTSSPTESPTSVPTANPTSSPTEQPVCNENWLDWNIGYGGCDTYILGSRNHFLCWNDCDDAGLCAAHSPTPVPSGAPTIAPSPPPSHAPTNKPSANPTSYPTHDLDCNDIVFMHTSSDDPIQNECVAILAFATTYTGIFDAARQAPNLISVAGELQIPSTGLTEFRSPILESISNFDIGDNVYLRVVSLPGLRTVGEHLIVANTNLTELDLPNIKSVGGSLRIYNNKQLRVVDSSAVHTIHGDLEIYANPILRNLNAFNGADKKDSFGTIGGSVKIYGNEELGLVNLPRVHTIGSDFQIYGNPSLIDLTMFNGVDEQDSIGTIGGSLKIYNNENLGMINLPLVRKVDENIDISWNPDLTAINMFEHVDVTDALWTVGGSVKINNNDQLTLINLQRARIINENVEIRSNPDLQVFNVTSVERIGGNLQVANTVLIELGLPILQLVGSISVNQNPSLEVLGLPDVQFVDGSLTVYDSPSVQSINLESVRDIGAEVNIFDTSLVSLHMSTVKLVHGTVAILRNPLLRELSMSKLQSIDGSLELFDKAAGGFNNQDDGNPQLVVLDVESLRTVRDDVLIAQTALTELKMPALITVGWNSDSGGYVVIRNNRLLHTLKLPKLVYVGSVSDPCNRDENLKQIDYEDQMFGNRLDIAISALRLLDLPELRSIAGSAIFQENDSLRTIVMWKLESIGGSLEIGISSTLGSLFLRRVKAVCGNLDIHHTSLREINLPFLGVQSLVSNVYITCNPSLVGVNVESVSVRNDVKIINNYELRGRIQLDVANVDGNFTTGLGPDGTCDPPTDAPTKLPTGTPSITPTYAPTEESMCSGDRTSWDAGFGGCATYHPDAENGNYAFCYEDCIYLDSLELCAVSVCHECEVCWSVPATDPDVIPTYVPTIREFNSFNLTSLTATGDIYIADADMDEINLPLLKSISGNATFENNLFTSSIDMPSLEKIDGSIKISGLDANLDEHRKLQDSSEFFSSLQILNMANLTFVGENLNIHNTALEDVHLSGLVTVGGHVAVTGNPLLASIDAPKIVSIGGALDLFDSNNYMSNPHLHDLNMGSIKIVGGRLQVSNTNLEELQFPNLESIGSRASNTTEFGSASGDVLVHNNRWLTAIHMPNMLSVGRTVDLCTTEMMSAAGHVSIYGNPALETIDMSNVQSVEGDLHLSCSESDFDCSNRNLRVANMTRLQMLCGVINVRSTSLEEFRLPALHPTVADVQILCNPTLTNIEMSNVLSIHGNIQIVNNPRASILMQNITLVEGELKMFGHAHWFDCDTAHTHSSRRSLQSTDDNRFVANIRNMQIGTSTSAEFRCRCKTGVHLQCQQLNQRGILKWRDVERCPEHIVGCCDLACSAGSHCLITMNPSAAPSLRPIETSSTVHPTTSPVSHPTSDPTRSTTSAPTIGLTAVPSGSPTSISVMTNAPTSGPLRCECRTNNGKLRCQQWNSRGTNLKWKNVNNGQCPSADTHPDCCELDCGTCLVSTPTMVPTRGVTSAPTATRVPTPSPLRCKCNSSNGKLRCQAWDPERTTLEWTTLNNGQCPPLETHPDCCELECGTCPVSIPTAKPTSVVTSAPTATNAPTPAPLRCKCNSSNGKLRCQVWDAQLITVKWTTVNNGQCPPQETHPDCCDLECGTCPVSIPTAEPTRVVTSAPTATNAPTPTPLRCQCNSNNGKLECQIWNAYFTNLNWATISSGQCPPVSTYPGCCELECGTCLVAAPTMQTGSPSSSPSSVPSRGPTYVPSAAPVGKPFCVADRYDFAAPTSDHGGCGTYDMLHPAGNHEHCSTDRGRIGDTHFFAKDVCFECGVCHSPQSDLLVFNMEKLQTVGAEVEISNTDIEDLQLPDLEFVGGSVKLIGNPSLTEIDMHNDEFINGHLNVYRNDHLTKVDLSKAEYVIGRKLVCDNIILDKYEGSVDIPDRDSC